MANEFNAIQELRNRLSENLLEDADDLLEFVQDASRLAALGDESGTARLPALFDRPDFAENLPEILKNRCEQGIWEVGEHSGEELALSLIDAQDFYCFSRRFPELLQKEVEPGLEVKVFFEIWWDACEGAELDEEAAETLRKFLEVFPISEAERLPVVNTPITDWELELLDYIYKDVELPVIHAQWSKWTSVS